MLHEKSDVGRTIELHCEVEKMLCHLRTARMPGVQAAIAKAEIVLVELETALEGTAAYQFVKRSESRFSGMRELINND